MKKIFTLIVIMFLIVGTLYAQTNRMSYQAVVRNANNELVYNENVSVQVEILNASGTVQYSERHTTSTNANGMMSLTIGGGTHVEGIFANVVWQDAVIRSVFTLADGATVTQTTPVTAVPYAMYAENAGNTFSGDYNDLENRPPIPTVPEDVSAFNNDAGYITTADIPAENDPTVPVWAKAETKPTYDYSEIENTPQIPQVPEDVSAFNNDAGYITAADIPAENDPTVPVWAKAETKPTYDYSEIENTPQIPQVPENVSVFNNDAGYITAADIPTIPTIPSDVSAFNNDARYVSNTSCDTVDICTLAATVAQLQQQLENMQNQLLQLPSVSTDEVSNISYFTANCSFTVVDDGGGTIKSMGICWSTEHNPTIEDESSTGYSYVAMPNLESGTTYYVRAFATNRVGTAYGDEIAFSTLELVSPTVVISYNYPSYVQTQIRGKVTENGGAQVSECGFCWSDSNVPTLEDEHLSVPLAGNNSFITSIENLIDGTTYYIRAYATNSAGTGYSETMTFTTIAYSVPTVTTQAATIDVSSAVINSGGQVTDNGGLSVTARGICWSTSPNPTIDSTHSTDGSGNGTFTSHINEISTSTTYYIRAYATNNKGTGYGEEITITTPEDGLLCPNVANPTDYDQNVYSTIKIGNQCWMAENLRTTHYLDGTEILLGSDTSSTIAYRYNPNNDANNVPNYGFLYNVSALMRGEANSDANPSGVQGICPNGWHIPSEDEWRQRLNYVNNNNSTLLDYPAGYYDRTYKQFGSTAYYWSTSDDNNSVIIGNRQFRPSGQSGSLINGWRWEAVSVRCLSNSTMGSETYPEVNTTNVINILNDAATCQYELNYNGGVNVEQHGVCWSVSENPTISDEHTELTSGLGSYYDCHRIDSRNDIPYSCIRY